MSIFVYPQDAYFNIINSNSTELGSYELPQRGDLSLAHLRVFHRNPNSFSYQMRLVLAGRTGGPTLAVSNWETFSNETTGQTGNFWLGDLTFTFEDYSLIEDPVYIRLENTGYLRSGNNLYLGVWLDWMQPVGITNTGGARIALGVKR